MKVYKTLAILHNFSTANYHLAGNHQLKADKLFLGIVKPPIMKSTTTLVFAIALSVTLTVTLIMKCHPNQEPHIEDDQAAAYPLRVQPKRISRFLAANEPKPRNPNAADYCHKDSRVCPRVMPLVGRNATCCNNKCVDLHTDTQNCGACKKKCRRPYEACCGGECVNLTYDNSHCGACNNVCRKGPKSAGVCIYGSCDYA